MLDQKETDVLKLMPIRTDDAKGASPFMRFGLRPVEEGSDTLATDPSLAEDERAKRQIETDITENTIKAALRGIRPKPEPTRLDCAQPNTHVKSKPSVNPTHASYSSDVVKKLIQCTDAFLAKRMSELQAKFDAAEEEVREKLSSRFGMGNEWRAFADRTLLDMSLNIQRLKSANH